jgi:hypothetical protein
MKEFIVERRTSWTGRSVVQVNTNDVGVIVGVDVDHDVALVRWEDGTKGWTPCRELEVTP